MHEMMEIGNVGLGSMHEKVEIGNGGLGLIV